jgi:hypothetical protein
VIHALTDVTVKVCTTDAGAVGHFNYDSGSIEISPKQTSEEFYHTLCHELIHYALHHSGASAMLWKLANDDDTVHDAIEEVIVTALENFLIKPGTLQFNKAAGSEWRTIKTLKPKD